MALTNFLRKTRINFVGTYKHPLKEIYGKTLQDNQKRERIYCKF